MTPKVLRCPRCGAQHVDLDRWATFDHHVHLCLNPECGEKFPDPDGRPSIGVASEALAVHMVRYHGGDRCSCPPGWPLDIGPGSCLACYRDPKLGGIDRPAVQCTEHTEAVLL